ncbi:MAG: RsmD family RNA methyltransferase [Chitinophagaceae bacterium]
MRIIHGRFKGFQFPPYHGSNTRPTTELVKESLFNTLDTYLDIPSAIVVDLFAGTGNIGLEFLSRGAASLISVDHFPANITYMKSIKKQLAIEEWEIVKSDVLKYVSQTDLKGDIIFADPPYDLPNIHEIVNKILQSDWFTSGKGIFILEHVDRLVFNHNTVFLKKQYGNTSFTGFKSK